MEIVLGIYAVFALGLGIFAWRDRNPDGNVLLKKRDVGATYWGAYNGHQTAEQMCAEKVRLPAPTDPLERAKWQKSHLT